MRCSARAFLTVAIIVGVIGGSARYAHAGAGKIEDDGTMDFEFNFRFPPTQALLDRAKDQIQRTAAILCDATDGQIRVENVRLTGGGTDEDRGDVWYFADNFRSGVFSFNNGSSLGTLGHHINLSLDQIRADVVAHEFGHLAFGLGEQYDEQRRFGSPCGIGRGFEPGTEDERNHSIMQQTGAQLCVAARNGCFTDADCPPGDSCQAVLMSELSTAANHDPVQGDSALCPAASPTTAFALTIRLNRNDPVAAFDPTSFATAMMTSQFVRDVEIIDSLGDVPDFFKGSSLKLTAFFEHLRALAWDIHFGIDDGKITGGTEGNLRIVLTVHMTFNPNGTLATISPADPHVMISDLADGADDLDLDAMLDIAEFASPTAFFAPDGALDGRGVCTADNCADVFNSMTMRYETSEQTQAHGDSDWQALVRNYPFVTAPAGLPEEVAPPHCSTPVNFTEDIVGTDQVMLFIDRSDSMKGLVDPAGMETRLAFAQAAARAFIDLQAGRGATVGMVSFNETPSLDRPFAELTAADADPFKTAIDALMPGGLTAIGDALTAAIFPFQAIADAGRTRTAFLLSDGENTAGSDPVTAAQGLERIGVRIFTIPVGSTADRKTLSQLARDTAGTMLDAPSGNELPAIYAELAARFRGESLALPRTESAVARTMVVGALEHPAAWRELVATLADWLWRDWTPSAYAQPPVLPQVQQFPFLVEAGAERLNVFLSARNLVHTTWDPAFRLLGPAGEIINGDTDPRVKRDPYYRIVTILAPSPGIWTLEVAARSFVPQLSFVLAHVENPLPDCLVDARPRVATAGPVSIAAVASFGIDLDDGVTFEGAVQRPDGSSVPLSFIRDPLRRHTSADFSAFAGRGIYDVTVRCKVDSDATALKGEVIFAGADPAVDVEPFERIARTSFFLDVPDLPPCIVADCDGDAIPNSVEGTADLDGDLLPCDRDDDCDGDDVPDQEEGTTDSDGDTAPDFQDPDSDNDGIPDGRDPRRTIADPAVCGDTFVSPGEQCDDGNRLSGDCCSAACQAEDLGTATCGLGVCQRTAARCSGGVPQSCVPGAPGVEGVFAASTCGNRVDDDCDGLTDRADGDCPTQTPALSAPALLIASAILLLIGAAAMLRRERFGR